MKKYIFFTSIAFFALAANAQTTIIPDPNFEQELINLGLDDVLDGTVNTTSIDTVLTLDLLGLEIEDLSGIEDFTALQSLTCIGNELTALDVSSNTNLDFLSCAVNNITELNTTGCLELRTVIAGVNNLSGVDFSDNTSLEFLEIADNNLENLDLTNNISLDYLSCSFNELTELEVSSLELLGVIACQENNLTSLDLSMNPLLSQCYCQSNELTYLNLKNGNNTEIDPLSFSSINNPNLNCIEVDDAEFSMENWPEKDDFSLFSEDCALSIDSNTEEKLTIYPNPAEDEFFMEIEEAETTLRLYNSSGKLVQTEIMVPGKNRINIHDLPTGLYTAQVIGNKKITTLKVIVR